MGALSSLTSFQTRIDQTIEEKCHSHVTILIATFLRTHQTVRNKLWICSQHLWGVEELSFWSRLDEFWSACGTLAGWNSSELRRTCVTILIATFLRVHRTDFHQSWICSQNPWGVEELRFWSRLDEFSLHYVVSELWYSLFWNSNDIFWVSQTDFAFRTVWVSIPILHQYYGLSDAKLTS